MKNGLRILAAMFIALMVASTVMAQAPAAPKKGGISLSFGKAVGILNNVGHLHELDELLRLLDEATRKDSEKLIRVIQRGSGDLV